ncbi:autotransporter-associated beta strand repeat-containing protein, partial [bacterium]|nr:autotransporter-associated beta strand repeat-containing protein [bacterium]
MFESITADGSRRLLVGARKDGVLKVTNGIHDSWSPDSKSNDVKKASLISKGEVVLGVSGGINPSSYKGLTFAMEGGSITTLENDAIGPQSPTLVRGHLQIGETSNSGVSQNFARRLIVGETGSIQNGDLSVTSLTNAGDVQIDSLTVNNGMKRLLDVLADRKQVDKDAPIRKVKAQGSLKNLGGNIEIAGDLVYQDNPDAEAGHALFNIGRPRLRKQPGLLQANRIIMGPKNDLIFNSGSIATRITTSGKNSINLGGGNDLILNRGSFEIGSSIIDGGEPLEITGSILNRDTRSVTGLNIFRGSGTEDPGVDENQLVNFAAIKLTAEGDWIFPQGNDCRVTGDGRTFSEDKTDCVGIIGQRKYNQFLQINDGATVETGVVELGRSSNNRIEVLDGSLDVGLIDGVIGSARINRDSGEIVFDRSVNASLNSLIVGDTFSTASVKAKAIHNISSIHVVNGSLDADLLHAKDLEDLGQVPELRIGVAIDSSLLSSDRSKSLIEQLSDNSVKGTLRVDETEGYSKAQQLGGMWGYEGDFGDINLSAQGIVTTTKSSDDKSIKDDADEDLQEDIDQVTFKSITAHGDRRLVVGAREDGKLTIAEGLHEKETSNKAAILNNGELVLGTSDPEIAQSSTYSGATVVMKDGHIQTLNADAISPASPTLVRGRLSLGNGETGEIEQNFAKRLIVGEAGTIENGNLSITSLTNAGDVQIDSLTVNNGMKRLLDVFADRRDLEVDSSIRKIKAQGSLKNLGGSIEITGDLEYRDNEDATAGHALINIRNLRDVNQYNQQGGVKPQPGTLVANSIKMGSNNDVILNSGLIATTTDDDTAINLGGGNDLILNRGSFEIGSSIIDGGEPLNITGSVLNSDARSATGLNIFRQGLDPYRENVNQVSGLEESQLVNFAAIKLEHDGDWIFPQGQDCQVRGDSKIFDQNTRCVGITGFQSENQKIIIENSARVEAGVVALGRDSTNTIHIKKGSLHAVLIEGGNEARDRFRQQSDLASNELTTQKEVIVLGEDNSDKSGELIVGGIVDIESITQKGGSWTYAINASEDDFGIFPATIATGQMVVKSVELPSLNGSTTVDRATFQKVIGKGNLQIINSGSLAVIDGIFGDSNTSLSTSGDVRLSGQSEYAGLTIIERDGQLFAENDGALSPNTIVQIEEGGGIDLQGFDNTIKELNGVGNVVLNFDSDSSPTAKEVNGANLIIQSGNFAGSILDGDLPGVGSVTKSGDGQLVLSGVNDYESPTLIQDGVLTIANPSALSSISPVMITGGQLDLSSVPRFGRLPMAASINYGYEVIDLTLRDQGSFSVSSLAPLTVAGNLNFESGTIAAFLDSGSDSTAPIQMGDQAEFIYGATPASPSSAMNADLFMILQGNQALQGDSTWNVIDGVVTNSDQLAENTFLLVPAEIAGSGTAPTIEINERSYRLAQFDGIDQPLADAALNNIYLEKGSLKLVVKPKTTEEFNEQLSSGSQQLSGCQNNDPFCDAISDLDGQSDQASDSDEKAALDIIDILIDSQTDVINDSVITAPSDDDSRDPDESLRLPVVFDYGQLARLTLSGLAPRNIDAPGRGLFNYNNLLVDTVFERLPIRQIPQSVDPLPVVGLPVPDHSSEAHSSETVHALWSQDVSLDQQDAQKFVDLSLAMEDHGSSVAPSAGDLASTADGNPSLTAELTNREGVRAWFRGFGGDTGPTSTTTFANDYASTSGGSVLGVDVSLSPSVQVGVFANYGDVNV